MLSKRGKGLQELFESRNIENENKRAPVMKIDKRQEREITIRFQENANRKVVDYKIIELQKFLI